GHGVPAEGRPVLPLPVPDAAAAGARSELRRGRRSRRAAGRRRLRPGDRGAEARARDRRAARRPAAALRRARRDVHRGVAPQGPGLSGVRRGADDHRVHRLRRVLRRAPCRNDGGARVTKVRIPPTLRPATGGEREVPATGGTVGEILDDLTSRFPGLEGQLRYANVYVDGEDIRTLDELETPVREGAVDPPAGDGGRIAWLAASHRGCSA